MSQPFHSRAGRWPSSGVVRELRDATRSTAYDSLPFFGADARVEPGRCARRRHFFFFHLLTHWTGVLRTSCTCCFALAQCSTAIFSPVSLF